MRKKGEMEARARSKELLDLEQEKPSFLESNFFVCKKEEEKSGAAQTKSKKMKKQGQVRGAEVVKQKATATVPTSHVLGKVKDFLGVIAQANENLQQSVQGGDRSGHDIEVLTGNETEYIEMDLLLGITDLQTPEAVAVAEAALGGSRQYLPLLDGDSSSDSEENTDEENDHIIADSGHSHSEAPNPRVSGSSKPIQSTSAGDEYFTPTSVGRPAGLQ
ncbi:hypothetical protein Taro_029757 [Colocasia esculenta]|uniref:Uncharacterized protein n=1 Tax=Colocasia esculenta TaxID=4460 RepID=A0A843VKL6_COLES|nr:hypothetical protein [Colocasia esculenta]